MVDAFVLARIVRKCIAPICRHAHNRNKMLSMEIGAHGARGANVQRNAGVVTVIAGASVMIHHHRMAALNALDAILITRFVIRNRALK